METLTGIKCNITPNQEYLLQGSIVDASVDVLIHRLRGLCDNVESGQETFHDHELVFTMSNKANPSNAQVLFRVRHALDHPDSPWHLRYLGMAEVGDKTRHTIVRSCYDVGTSSNVVQFLNEMGFKLDHEYVVKGFFFHKGRMKVTVSKIFKMLQPSNTENTEVVSLSRLVELSVVATQGQEQIQEDMKNFADQLRPLVLLEKIDPKRIQ